MRVSRGASVNLSVVEDDLEIEDEVKITCSGADSSLLVHGDIECDGEVAFTGNVKCDDFEGRDGKINIQGSLECHDLTIDSNAELSVSGNIRAHDVEVDREIYVGGDILADDIEVGGRFETSSVKAQSVNVGGIFRARGDVRVEDVEVGGRLEIDGKIDSRSLSAGGKAALHGGGRVTDDIEIGGVLTVDAPFEYGDIEVGGTAKLKGEARGRDIEVGGSFEVEGDLTFKEMEVGGFARITGNSSGEKIELGGRLSVDKDLRLSGPLEIGGTIEVGGDAVAEDAEIGGDFRASQFNVRNLELGGEARTERGIYAQEKVVLGSRSHVMGWVRALKEIIVKSRCDVDSISAPRIRIEDNARAKNVYAEDAVLEDRVEITGELLYTRSLTSDDDVKFSKSPEKVSQIPQEKSWIFTK